MNYSTTFLPTLLVLLAFSFIPISSQAQTEEDPCVDPDQFETPCGLVFDLCADYRKLRDEKTIDILVTANDDLGIFDPCDIRLSDDPDLLPQFGEVEQVTVDGTCVMRYTLTDPNYEPLDSFKYILSYIDECSIPEGYCDGTGKIWTIESKYYGEDGAAVIVSAKQGKNRIAFDTVYNLMRGDFFFINGTELAVNQTEWTYRFYSNGDLDSDAFGVANVHTSCSEEIFGVDFGVFTPTGGCVSSFKQRGTCVDRSNISEAASASTLTRQMNNEVDANYVADTTVVIISLIEAGLLPIDFGAITGKAIGADNLISWSINSVIDEEFLIVQSSTNGRVYKDLKQYDQLSTGSFKFLDTNVEAENTYYRFKMVSFNGYETYSRNISVQNAEFRGSDIKVFPNPVIDVVNIETEKEVAGYRLFNINGQLLQSSNVVGSKTINVQEMGIQSGLYILEVTLENNATITQKLTVL